MTYTPKTAKAAEKETRREELRAQIHKLECKQDDILEARGFSAQFGPQYLGLEAKINDLTKKLNSI